MAKRFPSQHETDNLARRQFESSLPSGWVVRWQALDYGIDAEVEVFEKTESTGIIFKVQLKGTRAATRSQDGRTVSCRMRMADLLYLCDEVGIPVVLVVADVGARETWWHAVQVDPYLRGRLREARDGEQQSLVVHLHTRNSVAGTPWRLLKKVMESEAFLSARAVAEADAGTFTQAMASVDDVESALSKLRGKASFLQMVRIERLWKAGKMSEVAEVVSEILCDDHAPREAKFAALLTREKLELAAAHSEGRITDYGEISIQTARKLKNLAKGGPDYLLVYAALAERAAELAGSARHDMALYMNLKVQTEAASRDHAEPLWTLMLPAARMQAAEHVLTKFRHCTRLLDRLIELDAFHAYPQAAERVIGAMLIFLIRLWDEGMAVASAAFERVLAQIAERACWIGIRLEHWEDVSLVALTSALVADPSDEDAILRRVEWARSRLQEIQDGPERESALGLLERQAESRRAAEAGPQEPGARIALDRQIYTEMAEAMGVRLGDPDDMLAEVIRIGIQDLDPGRVLRECQHLFVTLGSCGIPARMLQLPTAGLKYLHCVLHGFGVGALSLDRAYSTMAEEYCNECPDRNPHPTGWTWTQEWQQEQNRLHGNRFRQQG